MGQEKIPLAGAIAEPWSSGRGYTFNTQYLFTDDYSWPLHYHNDAFELSSVGTGVTGEMVLEGNVVKIKGNEVFFIPPGTIHSIHLSPNGTSEYVHPVVKIVTRIFTDILSGISGKSADAVETRFKEFVPVVLNNHHEVFFKSVKRLALFNHPDIWTDTHSPVPDDIHDLFSDATELFSMIAPFVASADTCRITPKWSAPVKRIVSIIVAHYMHPIALDEIARLSFLSKTYMCRVFKAHTGLTITEYSNRLRIEYAKQAMLGGESSMTMLAENCGFEYASYFSRIFRQQTGLSPKKWAVKNGPDLAAQE
jgi:AraC-like DNA-binding protein